MIIDVCSYKGVNEAVEEFPATGALLFIGKTDGSAVELFNKVDRLESSLYVEIDDAQPDHIGNRKLPESDEVLSACEFLMNSHKSGHHILICGPNGRRLAPCFAMAALTLKEAGGRKAAETLWRLQPKTRCNAFVLKLIDSVLGSQLYDAASSFGSVNYKPLTAETAISRKQERDERRIQPAADNGPAISDVS